MKLDDMDKARELILYKSRAKYRDVWRWSSTGEPVHGASLESGNWQYADEQPRSTPKPSANARREQLVKPIEFFGKKSFTIHDNDVGSEAYRDTYVQFLQESISTPKKPIEWGECQGPGAYWIANNVRFVFRALVHDLSEGSEYCPIVVSGSSDGWNPCVDGWQYQPYTQEKPEPPEKPKAWEMGMVSGYAFYKRNGTECSAKYVLDALNASEEPDDSDHRPDGH